MRRLFAFESLTSELEKTHASVTAFDFFTVEGNRSWKVRATETTSANLLQSLKSSVGARTREAFDLDLVEPARFREFEQFFDFAQKQIAQGVVQKLVPFVFDFYKGTLDSNQIHDIVQSQFSLPKSHDVFALWDAELKIFSISPEYLFWRKGRRVRTMALAGTARRDEKYSDHEFYNDAKEVKEHTFVVLDLLERIQKLNVTKIKKTERKIKKLKTLAHLWTEIEFEVDDAAEDDMDRKLVKILHPTAAMLGYPREASLKIIREHELQSRRGYFGAPMLFRLSEEESFCAINIRSLIGEKKRLVVGSGCGLVPQSQLRKEWDELAAKRASVLSGLQLM